MSVPPLVLVNEHPSSVPSKGILKRRPSAPTTLQRSSSWLATLNSRIGSAIHGTTEAPLVTTEEQRSGDGIPGRLSTSQTSDSLSFQLSKTSITPKLALDGAELKRVRFSVVQLTQVQLYDCREDDTTNGSDSTFRQSVLASDTIPQFSQRHSSLPKLYQIPLSPTDTRTQHVVPETFSSQNLLEIYHTACRAREESEMPIVRAILEVKTKLHIMRPSLPIF
ncbi:hypothetical protein Unana1_03062 [Umbelopsis nana]